MAAAPLPPCSWWRPWRSLPSPLLPRQPGPAAIQSCGGIGIWSEPAAQLGASFVNDGTLVADPFSQRL